MRRVSPYQPPGTASRRGVARRGSCRRVRVHAAQTERGRNQRRRRCPLSIVPKCFQERCSIEDTAAPTLIACAQVHRRRRGPRVTLPATVAFTTAGGTIHGQTTTQTDHATRRNAAYSRRAITSASRTAATGHDSKRRTLCVRGVPPRTICGGPSCRSRQDARWSARAQIAAMIAKTMRILLVCRARATPGGR